MKKLASGNSLVYCELTPAEFKIVAKIGQAQVADGTDIDIAWIKQISDFATANKTALQEVSTKAQALITSINAIP